VGPATPFLDHILALQFDTGNVQAFAIKHKSINTCFLENVSTLCVLVKRSDQNPSASLIIRLPIGTGVQR
jgi:hypothetical protein